MTIPIELLLSANLAATLAVLIFMPKRPKLGLRSGGAGRSIILDSCALIDGRIVELAEAGFIQSTLVVPSFIVRELQMLADGGDSQKRERARHGLDIAQKLKTIDGVHVEVSDANVEADTTDDKLIALAKKMNALLYTTDFNLSKVATVEGVGVLNINELAQLLRPVMLPGEPLKVKIIQKGSGKGQGVGYADDGTMIVVDNADRMMGKYVDTTVDRMHNTLAGKMIFAKRVDAVPVSNHRTTVRGKSKSNSDGTKKRVSNASREGSDLVTDLRKELGD